MKQITFLTEKQIADAWLPITVRELKDNFGPAGVKSINGPGQNSITGHVFGDAEKVSLIQIKLKTYLRYVDMGVGNGTPIGGRSDLGENIFALSRNERGQLHKYNRKPKKIYSRPVHYQIHKLSELILDNLGRTAFSAVEQGLEKDLQIKL